MIEINEAQGGTGLTGVWFQQDGAPPHTARMAREWVLRQFEGRVLSLRTRHEYPARSPDLTVLDYFLWGYLKHLVFKTRPETVEVLQERIERYCRQIEDEGIIANAM